ncbi:hypothetical protein QBC46DRAFT_384653 [Diplogelasinospora grovesii]|uniref:Required for respiratory growth protein 7, mitochondrial n=1 Tax=Diplogelasinospora grovesii TaxID=303347 RepID=A0AAN6N8Y8_9PEZI|nr:hypothetical protein QBC46DRAFT_384653 [Diplogelasinospora grovesii]
MFALHRAGAGRRAAPAAAIGKWQHVLPNSKRWLGGLGLRKLLHTSPRLQRSSSNHDDISEDSDDGLIYPDPPTTAHSDLDSFLRYSERTGLDPKSTVFVGTHYEYTVAAALSRFGFRLRRIGGASDAGIDLLGTWSVSSAATPARPQFNLRALVQCKAIQKSAGPRLVRELEGAFVGAPAGWRGPGGLVGFLVADRPATKGIRESLGRSRWPMGFISCSRAGHVEQILWNRRAEDEGLQGLGVAMRYSQPQGEEATDEQQQQLVLTLNGKHLPYVQ